MKSYPAVANTSPSDLKSIHKIEFFSTILESYFPDAACQYIIDPSEFPDKKTPFNLLGLSRLHVKHVVGVWPSEEPYKLAVNFPFFCFFIFVFSYLSIN